MFFIMPVSLMAENNATINDIIVDKTSPSLSVETVKNLNGEYLTHVTVNVRDIIDGGNPPSGVERLEYSLNGGANTTKVSFTGDSCSFDITEPGQHTLSVIVFDKAGNASGSHNKVQDPNNKFDFYIHGSENVHTVIFKDYDGAVIKQQAVLHGESATMPANPTREGYTFTGWDKTFDNVTEDLIVTAQYEENAMLPPDIGEIDSESVTLIWGPVDEAIYYKIKYTNNSAGANYEVYVTPEYTYTGDGKITYTVGDLAPNTQYIFRIVPIYAGDIEGSPSNPIYVTTPQSPQNHTVTFVDYDGTVLKTESVTHGNSATAPNNPTREGYTFMGWNKDFSNVISDLTVTAQYSQSDSPKGTVTIHYQDSEGNTIKDSDVYTNVEGTKTYVAPDIVGYVRPAVISVTFTITTDEQVESHTFIYSKVVLEGLNIIPTHATINVGGTIQYKVKLVYSDGTEQEIAANDVIWSVVEGDNLVTITNGGLLTALNAGSAEIGATYIDADMNLYSAYADVVISPVKYNITYEINPATGGSITVPSTAKAGDLITAIATPSAGYSFISWERNDVVVTTDTTYEFTMPASDVALRANFGNTGGSGGSGDTGNSGGSNRPGGSGSSSDSDETDKAGDISNTDETSNVIDNEDLVAKDNELKDSFIEDEETGSKPQTTEKPSNQISISTSLSTASSTTRTGSESSEVDRVSATDTDSKLRNNDKAIHKTGTVAGRILQANGKPMANIKVELHSEIRTTFTNKNGEFKFTNVPLGIHKVYLVDKRLKSGKSLVGNVRVIPNTKNISNLDSRSPDQGIAQCTLTDNAPVADLTIKLSFKQIAKTPSDYAKPVLGALLVATALLVVLVPRRRRKKEEE